MLVKKIAFGDNNEAFIESRLKNGLNIIYSDDNNRGKTLVMQGLMYSLGYDSIFPSTFPFKEKYFYSEIEVDGESFEFLRKGNSFVVKTSSSIQIFNSVSELKYFLDKHVFSIPRIRKENRSLLVSPSLLYEMFFVGQDNRNPAGLISRGQFNKSDFKNMIYSFAGLSEDDLSKEDLKTIKDKISKLQKELKETRKKITIIKSSPDVAEVFSKQFDSEKVQEKVKTISSLNEQISKLKRTRQREINRKSKLEQLISELKSLNQELDEGNVQCGECGSQKIIYTNKELTFDISNIDVRNGILNSISQNIHQKAEIIYDYSREINHLQANLNKELSETPPNFQKLILYQEQASSDILYDEKAFSLGQQIEGLKSQLESSIAVSEEIKNSRISLDNEIINLMGKIYRTIDSQGNLKFDDIFSKRDATFSGSEGQEFYFCKMISLSRALKHTFPILIDSFRSGEISSTKERKMLDLYSKIDKQIILTSTLKDEEYSANKYDQYENINSIDYSSHDNCKIMTAHFSKEFGVLISRFDGLMI